MLPIILVLLFAASALAAPNRNDVIELYLNSINEVEPVPSNGQLIGSHLLTNAFDRVDGGEKSTNAHYFIEVLCDKADLNNPTSQAEALAQAVAILIELSTGYPGDACEASNFINTYVSAMRSGNIGGARAAAGNYVRSLASGLDSITLLALNTDSASFATGRRGSCQAGGALYPFEAAWDIARAKAPSSELSQEHYCAASRLFNGFTVTSRNIAAAATAAFQPHVVEAFHEARYEVANLLAAVASVSPHIRQAAITAQQALSRAANHLSY